MIRRTCFRRTRRYAMGLEPLDIAVLIALWAVLAAGAIGLPLFAFGWLLPKAWGTP